MKKYLSGVATGLVIALAFSVCYTFSQRIYMRLNNLELTPDKKLEEIVNVLDKHYVEEYDIDKLYEGLYTGFVYGVGDPYTTYLSKSAYEKYMQDIEGSFTGVGIYVAPDTEKNQITVLSPIEGSPASEAGIRPKDVITKVNGISVYGDTLDDAIAMMKGPANTKVTITIYRESENRTFDVDIVRKKVDIPSVFPKMLEDDIGYIRISSFESATYDQFVKGLNDLKKQGMKGLIIDLRNNPGGLLDVVTKIADELVPEDTIVYTEDKAGNTRYSYSDKNYLNIPLVILVNENSASASEILAGAVKDLNSGKLVGTKTFGKGLVQSIYRLSDGSGVKVTISKYFTPSGVCINGVGIEPDYKVELDEEKTYQISSLEIGDDPQLQKAVEVVSEEMSK